MEKLAILGGTPIVDIPHPHFVWPEVSEDEIKAVEDFMRTGKQGTHGMPEIVEELENRFKTIHGVKFALALNSATSCLHAAYFALGIKEGDEVIVPNYTFPATALPLFNLGAIPVLCDCLKDTANIDSEDIERKISKKTKAIAVTHLWGHPCEMDEIMSIAKKHEIPVLEDCAHSPGAKYKGQLVGTFGTVSCFSLDNQKLLASGEGGVLLTNFQKVFEKSAVYSDFGGRVKHQLELPEFAQFDETGLGLKYRIHSIAAVIANEKLKALNTFNHNRISTLNYFSERLHETKSLIPPITKEYAERGGYYGYKPIYNASPLGGLKITDFLKILQAEGVDIRKTVTPPLHRTELFSNSEHYNVTRNLSAPLNKSQYTPDDFPNSEWFHWNHVSFATFSKSDDRHIIDRYLQAIHKVEQTLTQNPNILKKIKFK